MADLKGTIRLEDGDSLDTTLMVKSGRLRVVAGEHEIGNWPVDKLAFKRRNNDFHFKVEGEELVVHVDDPVALAQEMGLGMGQVEKAKGRKGRPGRKKMWGVRRADPAPEPEPVKAGPLSARMAAEQPVAPPPLPPAPAPSPSETAPTVDAEEGPVPSMPSVPEPIEITFDEEWDTEAAAQPDVPEVHEENEPDRESGLQPIELLYDVAAEDAGSPLQPTGDVPESESPSSGDIPPAPAMERPVESLPLMERFEESFSPPAAFVDRPTRRPSPVPEPEPEPYAAVEIEEEEPARPPLWQRIPLQGKVAGAVALVLVVMGFVVPNLLALLLFVAGMGTLFLAVAAKGDGGSTIMPPPFFGTDLAVFGGIGMVILAALIMVVA